MTDEELIYGKNGAIKMQLLKEGLINIEYQYFDYFERRNSRRSIEKHDRLHNHYYLTSNPDGVNFGFYASSDILEEIKILCCNLFNNIFNYK